MIRSVLDLELSALGLLQRSWAATLKLFVTSPVLALVSWGVLSLPFWLVTLPPQLAAAPSALRWGLGIVFLVAAPFLYAAVVHHLFHTLQSERTPLSAALLQALETFYRVLPAVLVILVGSTLGSLACYVPGILMMTGWFVAVPILVLEKASLFEVFRRSWHLTEGHRGKIFILITLIQLHILVPIATLGVFASNFSTARWNPGGHMIWKLAFLALFFALILLLMGVSAVVTYQALGGRKTRLEQVEQVFE